MSEAVVDDIVAVLPPLLQSLEALGFIARHLNPPDFGRVMEAAGEPDEALRAVRPRLAHWPEEFSGVRTALESASDAALAAFRGLRAVLNGDGDLVAVFRALRYAPRAQEALYPLCAKLPPVSEFFVEPALRDDTDLPARLASAGNADTGIMHDHNEPGSRGGFSLYVPEYLYAASRLAAGDGAAWRQRQRPRLPVELAARCAQPSARSWSRRPRPADTWALMGEDTDTPNLARILAWCGALEHRSGAAPADRHERRRHLLLRHRPRGARPSPTSRRSPRRSTR